MIWLEVGYNPEEGSFTTVNVAFGRVPCVGERVEFRDPLGGETDWPVDLNGNVFIVAEVCWIAKEEGKRAKASIFIVPKDEWEEEQKQ